MNKTLDGKIVRLQSEQYDYLKKIGLSHAAIFLYDLLLQRGALTAQQAADDTFDFPSAHYRLFYMLQEHALVRQLPVRPRAFVALPIEEGLQASLVDAEHQLKRLITVLPAQQSDMEIIVGRQALYDRYATLAKEAKQEISVYSIGIAFSDKLENIQQSALKRGVHIRHILQQYKLSNRYIVAKWHKAGVSLKLLERPRGFHFFVVDQRQVCITFSDPQDTDNRFSILTDNPAAVQLFVSYFSVIWTEAKKINS